MSDDSGEERAQRLITAALSICASGRQTASTSLCDEAQKQLKALWEDRKALRAENASLIAEVGRLREALIEIDALDPEHLIDSCAATALRGLVLRMGEIARAALGKE